MGLAMVMSHNTRDVWLINHGWLNHHTHDGSMYGIYANIYHQYTPNVSIYTIHTDPMGIGVFSCLVDFCFFWILHQSIIHEVGILKKQTDIGIVPGTPAV